MATDSAAGVERHDVTVLCRGVPATWLLEVAKRRYPDVELTLHSPTTSWTAVATDVFAALMELRERVEAEGVRICCHGARRNAWASGMQRDMGRGRLVYLLDVDRATRPDESVATLDPAPCREVATVEEQRQFYAAWLGKRAGSG